MKNPLLAAILNFVLPGVGYFYVGKRMPFGIMITFISIMSYYLYLTSNPIVQIFFQTPSMTVIGIVFSIAFAYDGYTEALSARKKK